MFGSEIVSANSSPEHKFWCAVVYEHFLHAQRGDHNSLSFFKGDTWKYIGSILFTETQRRSIEKKALEQKGPQHRRLRSAAAIARWRATRAKTLAAKAASIEPMPAVSDETSMGSYSRGVANVL